MPSTKALSHTQQHALETAADRPTRFVLPLPPDLPARGVVRQRLLAGLLQAGFVGEVPAADRACAWRTDATGRAIALRLTKLGLAAIGRAPAVTRRKARALPASSLPRSSERARGSAPLVEAESAGNAPGGSQPPAPSGAPPESHPRGKLGRVLASLSADTGATLPELVALTGWQPHTTRAALTRLRRRGYALERLDLDGRRACRLGAAR